MSYGTLQDTPAATGRAKVRFAPGSTPASSHHPDEDTSSETQDASSWERVRSALNGFYDRNFGLFLVFLAQSCGSVVSIFFFLEFALVAMLPLIDHGLDEYCSKVVSK